MKKLYTALFALGLAFGANAQNYTYQLDSSFNSTGFRFLGSTSGTQNVVLKACYLNDDKSSFIAGDIGSNASHYLLGAKLKANGELDSTLCGSFCTTGAPVAGSNIDMYKLQNNYYLPNTGFGGTAIDGLNPTTMDLQVYDVDGLAVTSSAQLNDSVVLETVLENGTPGVFAYNVRAFGSGYGGWNGHFVGTNYGHGDYVNFPGIVSLNNVRLNAIAVQSDKKIVVLGTYKVDSTNDVFVARFNVGTLTLDNTFGTNGIFRIKGTTTGGSEAYSMVIGSTDTIYINYLRGNAQGVTSYLSSLTPNGALNPNFSFAGQQGEIYAGSHNKMLITNDNTLCLLDKGFTRIATFREMNGPGLSTGYNNSSLYFDVATDFPNLSNFNMRDIKTNANGDLMLVGSADSNSVSRAVMIRLKKVAVTPASISNTLKATAIQVYPNPATNSISFNVENVSKNATASIFSIDGKLVATQAINNTKSEMNISSITKGMYVLQIKNGEQLLTSKFIKE